jgi:L-threonylcarbamoyladenylate synthase
MAGDNNVPSIMTADAAGIDAAAALLRAGRLVAVPTETVYGLAARADSVFQPAST